MYGVIFILEETTLFLHRINVITLNIFVLISIGPARGQVDPNLKKNKNLKKIKKKLKTLQFIFLLVYTEIDF